MGASFLPAAEICIIHVFHLCPDARDYCCSLTFLGLLGFSKQWFLRGWEVETGWGERAPPSTAEKLPWRGHCSSGSTQWKPSQERNLCSQIPLEGWEDVGVVILWRNSQAGSSVLLVRPGRVWSCEHISHAQIKTVSLELGEVSGSRSQRSPTFLAPGTDLVEDSFSMAWDRGNDFGMSQAHYIYCAPYFYFYYISSTLDHQTLDPGGWGPLF